MKIAFDLNVDDWVAFQEYYGRKKSPILYKWMQPLYIILAITLLVMGVWQVIIMGYTKYTMFILVCLAAMLFMLYIRKKAKDKVRQAGLDLEKKHPEAFGPMTMDFEERGIDIQSQKNSKSIAWDELHHYEANKDYYFLFSKKGIIYIVPKRAIEGSKDTDKLKATLDKYLVTE